MFKKILIKILIRLIEPDLKFRDDTAEKEWLLYLDSSAGFKSYLAVRSLYILKEMGQGLSEHEYHVALGQRKELMLLAARAQETAKILKNKKDDRKK